MYAKTSNFVDPDSVGNLIHNNDHCHKYLYVNSFMQKDIMGKLFNQ